MRRILLLAPAAALLLAALLPPDWLSPLRLCAVKGLTGADCPGCGMTRAFLLIAHGRVAEAAALHPLGVPAFVIVAGMALAGAARAITGPTRGRTSHPSPDEGDGTLPGPLP